MKTTPAINTKPLLNTCPIQPSFHYGGFVKDQHQYTVWLGANSFSFFTGSGWKTRPNSDDFFSCILSDMDAGSMSFDQFCAEFGYNEDSITDLNTYRACIESAKKVRAVLGHDQIEKLRSELQDY